MTQRGLAVRALGDVALRCIDLNAIVTFYRDVIGDLRPVSSSV